MDDLSPQYWYDMGVSLRKQAKFGEAVNAFRKVIELYDSLPERTEEIKVLRDRAEASIGLICEINGFVNVDLMNP